MVCICNITDFWWFVFTTILKGFDDVYSREDNQCNMFLYQEEKLILQVVKIFQVLHPWKLIWNIMEPKNH